MAIPTTVLGTHACIEIGILLFAAVCGSDMSTVLHYYLVELRQKANRKRQRPAEDDDDDDYEGGIRGAREVGWLEECAREWPVTRIRQSGFCGECNIIKHLGVLVVVVMGLQCVS